MANDNPMSPSERPTLGVEERRALETKVEELERTARGARKAGRTAFAAETEAQAKLIAQRLASLPES